jgi:hypothetical protein
MTGTPRGGAGGGGFTRGGGAAGGLLRGVRGRIDGWRVAATRITPATILVRGAVAGFGLLALLVGYPSDLVFTPSVAAALVTLATLPALLPRTRLTTAVIGVAVLGWLAATTAYDEPVTLARLVTLACLLYLLHTTAALAAVLPYDTVVSPAVLVNWLARTVVVLALTTGFAVLAAAGVRASGDRSYLVASISGLLGVVALAGLLAALRPPRP